MTVSQAPGEQGATAAVRSERLLAVTAAVARLVALVQVVPSLVSTSDMLPLIAVYSFASAETTWFIAVCLRRGRFDAWLAAVDTASTAALLWPTGWLMAVLVHDPHGYVGSPMYNYAAVATVVVGLARWPLSVALTGGAVLSASSLANSFATDPPAPVWNAIPDAIAFPGVTLLSWIVARMLRDTATEIDRERVAATRHAEDLARERDWAQTVAVLRNDLLSTLDNLAEGPSVPDDGLRTRVRTDAEWLREVVRNGLTAPPTGVVAALRALAGESEAAGLRLNLELPDHEPRVSTSLTEALVDAVREALTTVAKHSRRPAITLRGTPGDGGFRVEVYDHGRGLALTRTRAGVGLVRSIRRGLADGGGRAELISVPRRGVTVRMWVPEQG